jgi:hypothetical protein
VAHQKEKRDLERMLVDIENEEEKHCKVQKVIDDFLCWCEKVRPFIDDPIIPLPIRTKDERL